MPCALASPHALDLRVRHGLLTAVADARRSKNLDVVGALLFSFANHLPDLLGRAAGVDESLERSQNALTGKEPSPDGLTQILVFRRPSRKASARELIGGCPVGLVSGERR